MGAEQRLRPVGSIVSLSMDAASLVFHAHGEALRRLAVACRFHPQGLTEAARKCRKLSNPLKRRLERLDTTFCVLRHITGPYIENLIDDVDRELNGGGCREEKMKKSLAIKGGQNLEDTKNSLSKDEEFLMVREEKCSMQPISGWKGDNLLKESGNMDSGEDQDIEYGKGTIHMDTDYDALDELCRESEHPINAPMRMPISCIYKNEEVGEELASRVGQGVVKPGEEAILPPTHTTSNPCTGEVERDATLGQTRDGDTQSQAQDVPKQMMGVYSPIEGVQRREKRFFLGKAFMAFRQAFRKQKLERICAEHNASVEFCFALTGQGNPDRALRGVASKEQPCYPDLLDKG